MCVHLTLVSFAAFLWDDTQHSPPHESIVSSLSSLITALFMLYNQLPSVGEKETSYGGYRDLTLPCYYQHSKPLNTEKMLLWDFSPPYMKPSPTTPPLFTGISYAYPMLQFFFTLEWKKIALALYTLTSVSTFSVLFSAHFLFY